MRHLLKAEPARTGRRGLPVNTSVQAYAGKGFMTAAPLYTYFSREKSACTRIFFLSSITNVSARRQIASSDVSRLTAAKFGQTRCEVGTQSLRSRAQELLDEL